MELGNFPESPKRKLNKVMAAPEIIKIKDCIKKMYNRGGIKNIPGVLV